MRPKTAKKPIKVKCDGPTDQWTDGPTDGPTKRGVESRSMRLKKAGVEAEEYQVRPLSFLVAYTQLYEMPCPSVSPSVVIELESVTTRIFDDAVMIVGVCE